MAGDRPLSRADQALAESLGVIVAQLREEWRREMLAVAAEARAVIAEVRAVALEVALERHDPQVAARLRAIGGGRRD
jgi:hypothetical protein